MIPFIDLDNCDPINNRFGHNSGDLFSFRLASALIRSANWRSDPSSGGDEFLVVH
ncbi:diguanylate cyclase domain-containing protein [Shigella flexneri]